MAWFTAPSGVTCVGAYDFIGAASLADSYTNEAGGAALAPGVAPGFTVGVGQVYDGMTQYLLPGLTVPNDQTWSFLARCTNAAATGYVVGVFAAAARRFGARPNNTIQALYENGGQLIIAGGLTGSHVIGVAGATGYLDGVAVAGSVGAPSGAAIVPYLGARNRMDTATVDAFFAGTIAALAIYSGTLLPADVVAITAAMFLLEEAGGAGGSLLGLESPFVSGGVMVG